MEVIKKGLNVILDLCLRSLLHLDIFKVHAWWQSSRKLELEGNSVVAGLEHLGRELEARGLVSENVTLYLPLYIVILGLPIVLVSMILMSVTMLSWRSVLRPWLVVNSFNERYFLGSFHLKDDLLSRDCTVDTEVDSSSNEGTWVVDWLAGLDHHVTELILTARVDVSHNCAYVRFLYY